MITWSPRVRLITASNVIKALGVDEYGDEHEDREHEHNREEGQRVEPQVPRPPTFPQLLCRLLTVPLPALLSGLPAQQISVVDERVARERWQPARC